MAPDPAAVGVRSSSKGSAVADPAAGGPAVLGRPPAGIRLEGVSKYFGTTVAIDDLSLDVLPGEMLVLLGPSGCGKSTVLRLVAGLEEPTAGLVYIADEVVNGVDPKDRDIAMVFQSYALYPHLSVRRNIEFPLRARGVGREEREAAANAVAGELHLDKLLDRKPGQLSGGQRQRVALARAIVRRPRAFLMDEPLSNLDAQLRAEMRIELAELQARLGITVIYVTHDQTEAMTLGHRVAVLRDGVLQQLGTPEDVSSSPANAFVAGFIGNPPMSIVEGQVSIEEGEPVLRLPGGFIPLGGTERAGVPGAAGVGALQPGPILVGLRPNALRVGDEGTLLASVSLVEHTGRLRYVVCKLPNGERLVVEAGEEAVKYRSGDAVRLAVDAAALYLFDASTTKRLP